MLQAGACSVWVHVPLKYIFQVGTCCSQVGAPGRGLFQLGTCSRQLDILPLLFLPPCFSDEISGPSDES